MEILANMKKFMMRNGHDKKKKNLHDYLWMVLIIESTMNNPKGAEDLA